MQEAHGFPRWGRLMGQEQRGYPAGVDMGPLAEQLGVKRLYPGLGH